MGLHCKNLRHFRHFSCRMPGTRIFSRRGRGERKETPGKKISNYFISVLQSIRISISAKIVRGMIVKGINQQGFFLIPLTNIPLTLPAFSLPNARNEDFFARRARRNTWKEDQQFILTLHCNHRNQASPRRLSEE